MGREFLDDALAVDIEREGVRVTGFAGLPTLHRPDPGQQYLFVNGRPVQGPAADRRRARGLRRPAAQGRAIRCWRCSSTLPPREVDVNVHPSKAEVRFRDAARVRALVVGALAAGAGRAPAIAPPPRAAAHALDALARGADRASRAAPPPAAAPAYAPRAQRVPSCGLRRGLAGPARRPGEAGASRAPTRAPPPSRRRADLLDRPLGAARAQLHETYIVAQTRDVRRHRRPARRPRAPGLRAPEGRARQRRRRAPGPADPRDRRPRRRRGRSADRARGRARPRSASSSRRSEPAPCWCARCRRCSATPTSRAWCATSPREALAERHGQPARGAAGGRVLDHGLPRQRARRPPARRPTR